MSPSRPRASVGALAASPRARGELRTPGAPAPRDAAQPLRPFAIALAFDRTLAVTTLARFNARGPGGSREAQTGQAGAPPRPAQ